MTPVMCFAAGLARKATVAATSCYKELGELVRSERAVTLERVKERLGKAAADGEIRASVDIHALARFVQTIQNGMSLLARDGADRAELEAVAEVAMQAWDARVYSPAPAGKPI